MKLVPRCLVVLWLFFLALAARADEVDAYVRMQMEKQHIPGLELAVVKEGKVVKAEGYGWANVEKQAPVKPDTVFQLQSVTKSFTATGIMLLVEEGKVGLDDWIGKYLGALPASWSNITVRHLLTHTSGIKDFINEPTVDLKQDITPGQVIDSLRDRPLNFSPGEKYAYSNTGYHLLGMIIHKVTGKTWGEFLRERIITPLGMQNTGIVGPACSLTNLAAGYIWRDGKQRPGAFVAPTILGYAGGGMLSTVLDLARWDAALYTEKVLRRSSLEQMWTPAQLNDGARSTYGFGWAVDDYRGHKLVTHSGAHATGFRTTFLRFLDEKLTVIVLANLRDANPDEIARGVAAQYIPRLRLSSLEAKPDPEPAKTERLKSCLFDLARTKDSPLLTPEFRADYAKASGRAESLATRLQRLKSFTFLGCDDVTGRRIERLGARVNRVCFYKMVAGEETRYYTFYLTAGDQVAMYQSSGD